MPARTRPGPDRSAPAYPILRRRLARALLAVAVGALALGSCSKSRADDFSRFKPSRSLQATGAEPRAELRYRPAASQQVTYQLSATVSSPTQGQQAKMRLRVVLGFGPGAGAGGAFKLRLLSIVRLDPPPPGGRPELGPAYVLLQGVLGAHGELADLLEGDQVPSPVNLALAAPLLFPELPRAKVGVGARWKSARRHGWTRQRTADPLTGRTGYKGSTTALLETAYHYESKTAAGGSPVISAQCEVKLRSRTQTLGRLTRHGGTARVRARYELDADTSLPDQAKVTVEGSYQLRSNDASRPVKQKIELTFRRER